MSSYESSNQKPQGIAFAIAATAVVTVVLLPFAWYFGSASGVIAVFATALACLLPTLVGSLLPASTRDSTAGLLFATGVRMALVFGVCVIAKEGFPSLTFPNFFLWVVLVYATLLAVDTVGMLRSLPLTRRISS
ncbi:MAG: hypothetical protein AB8G99_21845 [Planctomycetaceae bacterium]